MATLLLAGCSGESSEPVSAPSTSADVHVHDETHEHDEGDHDAPGPPPPAAPHIVEEESAEGASAFTTYFFEVVEPAYANLQTGTLEKLATPDCAGCAAYVEDIIRARAYGERYQGGATHVLTAAVRGDVDPDGTTVAATTTVEGRVRTNDVTGEVVKREKAQRNARFEVVLQRVDDGWRVARVDRLGNS